MTAAVGPKRALVLFSGGQDSTTCLAWALARFDRVETVGFDYGQRHAVELECRRRILERIGAVRPEWAARLGMDHTVDLRGLGAISETALTREREIEFDANGLPTTFVPGRNLLFFTYAAAIAYRRGIRTLVGGMCETDYSGYPDCRDSALKSLQASLELGIGTPVTIETPLMWLSKGETWSLARSLGGDALVELVRAESHTCYTGSREPHDWGCGCGKCPACLLREAGWRDYQKGR